MKYKATLDVITLTFQDEEKYKHAKTLVQNFGPHFCMDFPGYEKLYNDNEKTITIKGLKPEFVIDPLNIDGVKITKEKCTIDSERTVIVLEPKDAYDAVKRHQILLKPENAEKGLSFFSVSFSDEEKRLTVDGLKQDYIKEVVKRLLAEYGMQSTMQNKEQELKCIAKLDYDYIESNTMWVLKYDTGERRFGAPSELLRYKYIDKNAEMNIAAWENQPKELKQFYKDYEYAKAKYCIGRHEFLDSVKNFYDEWIKNPDIFRPEKKPVTEKLSEALKSIDTETNLVVYNYDLESTERYKAQAFKEVTNMAKVYDFDVISIEKDTNGVQITVMTDEHTAFKNYVDEVKIRGEYYEDLEFANNSDEEEYDDSDEEDYEEYDNEEDYEECD